jgi:cupin 2 domain-containing protein
MQNLFDNIPEALPEEQFDTLIETGAVRIERIVSQGHTAPAAGWYDQDHSEWVLLLKGAARLAFEDGREIDMSPGDWLEIPSRQMHRVAWTDPHQSNVWLAVHYL